MTIIKYRDKKLGRHTKGFYKKKPIKGFRAAYAGTCMECQNPIKVGTMIGWFAKGKVYHIVCPISTGEMGGTK